MTDDSKILAKLLVELKEEIILRHTEAGQLTTGETANTLEVKIDENRGALVGAKYIGVLERGRKPGKTPKGFDNIIADWIVAKGLSIDDKPGDAPGEALERMAKAIAWNIRLNGTRAFRDPSSRYDIFTGAINDFVGVLNTRFEAEYKNYIFNNIVKLWK